MTPAEIVATAIAVLSAVAAIANMSDDGRARFATWVKVGVWQAIMLFFIGFSTYGVVKFFNSEAPITRSEIGYLLMNSYNFYVWGRTWLDSIGKAIFSRGRRKPAA